MSDIARTTPIKAIALLVGALFAAMLAAAPASTAHAADLAAGSIDDQTMTTQEDSGEREASWSRVYGETALDTMQKIVQVGWLRSDVVVIATSEGYWDALAASSLAGAYSAPVMFTERDVLSAQTKAEIERLAASKAYIVGGPNAVSANVESQIAAMGLQTERLWGENAMGTAIAIANALGDAHSTTCIIATSAGYWDALCASPYSYASKSPIFLTNVDGELEGPTLDAIKAGGYTRAVIAGGNLAVMPSVEGQLAAIGVGEVKRCWGQNAYETAVDLANWEVSQGMGWTGVGIATGNGYWDALAGAALCGRNKSVLLLADEANSSVAASRLHDVMYDVKSANVFGGPSAVSDGAYGNLQQSTSTASGKSAEELRIESLNGWWESAEESGMSWLHFVNGAVYYYDRHQSDKSQLSFNGPRPIFSMEWYDKGEIGAAKDGSCCVVKIDHTSQGSDLKLYRVFVRYDNEPNTLHSMNADGEKFSDTYSYIRTDNVPGSILEIAADMESK